MHTCKLISCHFKIFSKSFAHKLTINHHFVHNVRQSKGQENGIAIGFETTRHDFFIRSFDGNLKVFIVNTWHKFAPNVYPMELSTLANKFKPFFLR